MMGGARLLGLHPRLQPHAEQLCLPLGTVGPQKLPGPNHLELGDGDPLDTTLGGRLGPGL